MGFTYDYRRQRLLMTTQDIKAIKVLSIYQLLLYKKKHSTKTYIKTNSLIKIINYYLFGGQPVFTKKIQILSQKKPDSSFKALTH